MELGKEELGFRQLAEAAGGTESQSFLVNLSGPLV